ncbi:hypothetical protein D9758_010265 [Tetrapyrgos nigripes]|uniref:Uncharacterized protein n=1 Tax=Tetrapyrgos nigripes TaxID=182062 RepID=A0A8H5GAD7_9AGAR|nr:hypothetical protein D9758_010265 [Tetrapyrgos nigripes]
MSSMPQAQQQSQPLAKSDLDTLKTWLLQVSIAWLLYGVNATLVLTVVYNILSQKRHPSKPQLVLLTLVISMLTVTTAPAILQVWYAMAEIPLVGYNVTDPEAIMRLVVNIYIADTVIDRVNFVIGDGIVVWRAWIMYPQNLLVKSILIICFMASIVGTFVNAGLTAAENLNGSAVFGEKPVGSLMMSVPLLVTNMVATALIGYKAWVHIAEIRKCLKDCGNQIFRAQKVLLLLVESGLIYCGLWIAYSLLTVLENAESVTFQVFYSAMPSLAALYPVLIIMIVSLEKSRVELNDISLSQSIRFASVAQQEGSQAESQTDVVEQGSELLGSSVDITNQIVNPS